ncbi:MAG: hypothetical protein MH472_04455 [Bacteroidia bacterium]|nr:hypothetical protein [Bacteroidia bacterium]
MLPNQMQFVSVVKYNYYNKETLEQRRSIFKYTLYGKWQYQMKTKLYLLILCVVLLSNHQIFAQGGLRQFFNWVSSPLRPVWGEYSEPGQTPYPPLTSFYDKSKSGETITSFSF